MKNSNNYSTSDQAEEVFYLAFQQSDIKMMMSVWSKSEGIICIHPGGPRLEGWDIVRQSWEHIFINERGISFDVKQKKILEVNNISIHHVIEVISVNGEVQSGIIATNIYAKTENGWHMILHHASPELLTEIFQSDSGDLGELQTVH